MAKEAQDKDTVKDESFDQTGFKLKDYSHIFCVSIAYPLDAADFTILTKVKSAWSFSINGVLMCAGALALNVAAKYINSLITKQTPDIKNWELIAIGIGVIIPLFLKWISNRWPDEKKRLIKKIDNHFKTSKKHIGVLNKNE